jgi:hypothetical protein
MEKEFLPYDRALKLKAIGFDERCFTRYYESGKLADSLSYLHHNYFGQVNAPTFQQAFRWFREKYNLFGEIYIANFGADEYSFDIYDLYEEKTKYDNFIGAGASYSGTFDTYEEVELACLDKLIEIVEGRES